MATPTTFSAVPKNYTCPPSVLFAMCIGVSLYWLFALSMGALLPSIGNELGIKIADLSLPMSLAGLASGIFIMPAGGLADRVGRLRMTRLGLAVGLVGMILCGTANSIGLLIAGRLLQGLAAAIIMPATLGLVKAYYDDENRPKALSFWSMATFGCASVSSIFGGLTATLLGWRWAFLLAIPFILAAFWMLRSAPESKVANTQKARFDAVGFVVLIIGLFSLNLLVAKGNTWGWTSANALVALGVFVLMLLIFISVERRHAMPIADLSLFGRTVFTGSVLANLFINSLLGILIVSLIYLQKGRGLSAMDASLLTLSYTVTVLTLIRVGEKMSKKMGPRVPMVLGSLCMVAAAALLSCTFIKDNTVFFTVVLIGMAFMGSGLGLFATPAVNTAVGQAPADKAAAAGGIFKMASSLGGAFGIAFHLAVFGGVLASTKNIHVAAQYGIGIGVVAALLSALTSFMLVKPSPTRVVAMA